MSLPAIPRGRFGALASLLSAGMSARLRTIVVAALVMAFGAILASAAPSGLGESGISLEPARGVTASPWLVYEVSPGETVMDEAVVTNSSATTARDLTIYPADARAQPDGVFVADLLDQKPRMLGSWIQLDTSKVNLQPRAKTHIHLTLRVPATADAGEYEASILAQFETASENRVRIVHRVGLRVYLTVKGSLVESARISAITAGHWWERGWPQDPVVLRVSGRNSSKVHLKVNGTVSADGARSPLEPSGKDIVVPRDSPFAIRTEWPSHPWIGRQYLTVDLAYGNRHTGRTAAVVGIWYIPWKLLLVVLSVLLLTGYLGRAAFLRLRRGRTMGVNLGGVSLRMTVVDPADHPEDLPAPAAGSTLVVVALQVANEGSRPFTFERARFKLLDGSNNAFAPDRGATAALEAESDGPVAPGARGTVALAFQVPAGTRPRAGIYRGAAGNLIAEIVAWRR
ncbi:MAG: DUF4352 domain-containing protein [Candidatus Dormibacteria bacterium]